MTQGYLGQRECLENGDLMSGPCGLSISMKAWRHEGLRGESLETELAPPKIDFWTRVQLDTGSELCRPDSSMFASQLECLLFVLSVLQTQSWRSGGNYLPIESNFFKYDLKQNQ